ncbi:TetR/AcrR family transcriptional regulator [Rhodohalobacter sp. SW132]|uniref:TetR/AcrR family transcriptional regulator n=1 Tax=Rhodohalobacter sp. SW132 TaxID=2293433 RepID=UPI000E273A4D|nr:TetR/AcrR family transcriptional regulator [Rhodohalobacter sp. SW132]REL33724.1 TetR/AcrR family transcriptional regulator [Rhodohalobacter sp. SW132]
MSQTKIKILATALTLFNRHGLPSVSQHKISDELGISPGNLTYHFRQKDDIVEALYFDMVTEMNELFEDAKTEPAGINDFIEITDRMFRLMMKYRFIFIDIIYLLRNNAAIASDCQKVFAIRKEQFLDTIEQLVKKEVLREEKLPREYDYFFRRLELLTDFYLPASELTGEYSENMSSADFRKQVIYSIYPYLTPKGLKELPEEFRALK